MCIRDSYVASEELMRAVNIAMVLEKPLLIKGEPGTGKTMLAEAISQALGKKLIIWNIKSTTKAQDGLYVYDVVQRLYDSQFGGEGVDNIEKYVKLGKLGEAFTADEQVILLIDEIDKADLEFPNDLLWELDRMEFHIPETGRTVTAKQRPVVILSLIHILVLEKPLLIKGEPGTGKTMLAEAISQALGKKLIIWNIKSTTKAQDGLYVYDVVQRLYDSQFGGEGVDNIEKYVKLGKLGEAFTADEQVILLIDEIDKADLEFPNDLLWELDRMEFHIPETGRTVTAKQRPVVIITSNAEKELPDAFLRRCVFHYIEFPGRELMAEIVRVHFPSLRCV